MESGSEATRERPDRTAPRHPIGVVAARTGLTPDVLRIWERRYRAVDPARTAAGQRLYSDADVERLQLLQRATAQGRGIGQLVQLTEADLRALVRDDAAALRPESELSPAALPDADVYVELALERTLRLDAPGLDALLRRLALLWGTSAFLESLAAPLFRRIGVEWHERRLKPAQEHMATAVMRTVLMSLQAELSPTTDGPRVLVATPVDERHEIGALLVAAAAAAAGWRVTYLGTDLPAGAIAEAAADTGARAVGLSVIFPHDTDAVAAELRLLRGLLPESVDLLVGGRGAALLGAGLAGPGVHVLAGLPELRDWLRRPR